MAGPFWFMGSGTFGERCLEELCALVVPDLVVTSPPRRAGRGLRERVTYVERLATERGIEVHRSAAVNDDRELKVRFDAATPQAIFVVDFGQKVLGPYLETPPFGCINIHPSLLPRYRGAAPLQRALMNGESQTGVSIFRLVEAMDAGPVLASASLPIALSDTYGNLLEKSAEKGGLLLREVLKLIDEGRLVASPQDSSQATFAPKIVKEETKIKWARSAGQVHDLVRALNPMPGAFTLMEGRRLKIWESFPSDEDGKPGSFIGEREGLPLVGCGKGSLLLVTVQPEGKKPQPGGSWLRGLKTGKGEILFEQT